MSHAFLFPGQGSEGPEMGGAALGRPGPVRRLVERASAALEVDLEAIVRRGDPSLARTELGQPALVAISLGLALESLVRPSATAGHSVGELAAFALAGCLSPEDAVDCTVERARLMADAARRNPGSMAALRASVDQLQDALALGRSAGSLELAAHNSPEELVVTGDRAALAALSSRYFTVPLSVSGPWHSAAMRDAADSWRLGLERLSWQRPRVPLVSNATGSFVRDENLVELLAGQLSQPVQWVATLGTLRSAGIQTFDLFGPARVLRGLCRANLGTSAIVVLHDGVDSPELRA